MSVKRFSLNLIFDLFVYLMLFLDMYFFPSLFHRLHSQPSTSPCVWVTQTFGCPSRRARSVNRKSHPPLPRRFLPSSRSVFKNKQKQQKTGISSVRWNTLLFIECTKSLRTPKTVRLCLWAHLFTCGLTAKIYLISFQSMNKTEDIYQESQVCTLDCQTSELIYFVYSKIFDRQEHLKAFVNLYVSKLVFFFLQTFLIFNIFVWWWVGSTFCLTSFNGYLFFFFPPQLIFFSLLYAAVIDSGIQTRPIAECHGSICHPGPG